MDEALVPVAHSGLAGPRFKVLWAVSGCPTDAASS